MIVQVREEAGYENALLGLSLSYYDHAESLDQWWNEEKIKRAERRAKALAFKGGGHNKFLESMQAWIYVQAARSFWSEFDTYRVGMTKQSSSTMHTLDKRPVNDADFESGTCHSLVMAFNEALDEYKDADGIIHKDITALKNNLPEGWLQERMICTNYMTLQNICGQREGHRLKYWNFFIDSILEQVEHPEFIKKPEE